MTQKTTSFAVAQIGARMHYAIPTILHGAGMLRQLYTDLSVDHGISRLIKYLPRSLDYKVIQKIKGRRISGVPVTKTTAYEMIGYRYALMLSLAKNENDRLRSFMWIEKEFSKRVVNSGLGNINSVYAFNGAALNLFEYAKRQGIKCILEQTIAPKRIENEILCSAYSIDKEISDYDPQLMNDFILQEEKEWELADHIVCASDFVRDGLIKCGVSPEKCRVIPYGVDLINFDSEHSEAMAYKQGKTLNVLFVGAVGTRKGIWTLFKAMELLLGLDIKCRVVGPFTAAYRSLSKVCPSNTEIVGPVPRLMIPSEFYKADVFCLPSLCEGSATVTYEALAAGLPVVTTHNSGSIVRDGVDGFIVPHSDEYALAAAIKRLFLDREQRLLMGKNAIERSRFGSQKSYSARLVSTLLELG